MSEDLRGEVYSTIRDLTKLMVDHYEFATYMILNSGKLKSLRDCARQYMLSTLDYFPNTSKIPHRAIMANMYFTEQYLEKEFTYLDIIDDYHQIQNIIHSLNGYQYMLSHDLNIYKDFDTKELRHLSDSWSCMNLEFKSPELRHAIEDDLNIHTKDISEFVEYAIEKNMAVELVEANLHRMSLSVFNKMYVKYSEDVINDSIEFNGLFNYTAGYLNYISLKRFIRDLSKAFDSYDYLIFIHSMFQINRWNYNSKNEVD